MSTPIISVIIPVYGVEKYISECAKSLFCQTMTDGVEYLFINDATKDGSIDVLEKVISEFPGLKSQIRIISHEKNKGLPAARNTGLKEATGTYVVHVDGDDYCEKDMLESLYNSAISNDSDFVWCDYYITFGAKKRIIKQPDFHTPLQAVTAMLRGSMKYNVWNKLCRRSIYIDNGLSFPDGNAMGEDLTMILVALNAKKCSYVGKPLYNYVQSETQMTSVYTEKKFAELQFNCRRVREYIDAKFGYLNLEKEYSALEQLMKWPFLLDGKLSSYRRWKEWFPESNKYIWETKGVNNRIRFVEWCAAKGFFPLVWVHYILVIKLFYGIVYK